MMKHYVRLACFVGGALFGSVGVKTACQQGRQEGLYPHYRRRPADEGQRNGDRYLCPGERRRHPAAAKDINEARAAKEAEAQVEGQEA